MGYAENMRALLRPLRLYELDSGFGAAELNALGSAMDDLAAALESDEKEAIPVTAGVSGLGAWESILPYRPCYITLADRRAAVAAMLRTDGRSFTPDGINGTLAACGLSALARETATHYTVEVSFPDNRGMLADLDRLKARIEAIVPCHLAVEYLIIYITWAELESWYASWAAVEDAALTWDALERSAGSEA